MDTTVTQRICDCNICERNRLFAKLYDETACFDKELAVQWMKLYSDMFDELAALSTDSAVEQAKREGKWTI